MNDETVDFSDVSTQTTRRQWLKTLPLGSMAVIAATGMTERSYAVEASVARHQQDSSTSSSGLYNVRDFGAKGDGVTLDTAAVQAAIDACARGGGGTVLVPPGNFVIGTTELKSNINLQLSAGATLLGSIDGKQYHAIDAIPLSGDITLVDGNWALLFAVDAKNISIEGPGTIDGRGSFFHSKVQGTPAPSGLSGPHRPYHLMTYRCEGVSIRNVKLIDCAYHSLRIIQSKRVDLDGLYIHSRVNGNNDGFHFISSEHVTISNCTVLSLDDACALFGSCKFIAVTNCYFSTRWSVFRFGGGHAQNITVSNCIFHQVYGCPIKFQGNPGSRYENMSFANLVFDDVTGPIHLGLGPRFPHKSTPGKRATDDMNPDGIDLDTTPATMHNVSFTNILGNVTTHSGQITDTEITSRIQAGETHSCIVLNCVGGSTMENISLCDINLTFGGGGTAEEGSRRDIPKYAGEYFMLGPMPAYGFYARGVRGLTMQNVRLQVAAPDLRPAFILDDVVDATINGLTVQGNSSAEAALRISDSRDIFIGSPRLISQVPVFLQLEGSGNDRITLEGGDISYATRPITYTDGATDSKIRLRL